MASAFVHTQLKDVRRRVVADDVEVELAADDLRGIDLGGQDGLAIQVRPGQERAEGIDDAAAAAI